MAKVKTKTVTVFDFPCELLGKLQVILQARWAAQGITLKVSEGRTLAWAATVGARHIDAVAADPAPAPAQPGKDGG